MGKSNRLRFSAGLDRKPEWAGAGLRRFYCITMKFLYSLDDTGASLSNNIQANIVIQRVQEHIPVYNVYNIHF